MLLSRLISNHPLPDGNKRSAMACTQLFVAMNGLQWNPHAADAADADESFKVLLAIASGSLTEEELVSWVRQRLGS